MVDLNNYRPAALPPDNGPLGRLRISSAPVQVVIPSTIAAEASIHWVEDVGMRGPIHCPGVGCPVCHLGDQPKGYLLVPAIEVGRLRPQVILASKAFGPKRLVPLILPHLAGGDLTAKYFSIRREEHSYDYFVEVHPISKPPAGLDEAIAAYKAREHREGEALLNSAVEAWSAQDLAMLPGYQRQLELRGDWEPPSPPSFVQTGN